MWEYRSNKTALIGGIGTILFLLLLPQVAVEAEDACEVSRQEEGAGSSLKWHVYVGASNYQPRFEGMDKEVRRQVNGALRHIAPGYDGVETFIDLRDNFVIWIPEIGIGRTLSPRWDLFAHIGYLEGSVVTEEEDTSIVLRLLHSKVKLHAAYYFAGAGLRWYPWSRPELRAYDSLKARLRNIRPYFAASANWVRVKAHADIVFGLKPYDARIKTRHTVSWSPWEARLAAGLQAPLGPRTSLNVESTYHLCSSNGDDLDGFSLGLYWQWHF